MATTHATQVADSFTSTDPATDAVVGTFPIDGPEAVAAAVARAREAAAWWAGLGFARRRERLLAFKSELALRSDQLCRLITQENGKPHPDAFIEVMLVADHLHWAARNASRVLGQHRAASTLLAVNHAASVVYEPLGVVGVIGPWN